MSFTPDPWTAQRCQPDTLYYCHVLIEPHVAAVYAPEGNAEAAANVALITAAPAIYEALIELLAAYEHLLGDAVTPSTAPRAWVQALSALAKAEGR